MVLNELKNNNQKELQVATSPCDSDPLGVEDLVGRVEGGHEVKELLPALVQLDRVQGLRLLQLEGAGERHRGLCGIIQSGVGWNHSEPQTDQGCFCSAGGTAVSSVSDTFIKIQGKMAKRAKMGKMQPDPHVTRRRDQQKCLCFRQTLGV